MMSYAKILLPAVIEVAYLEGSEVAVGECPVMSLSGRVNSWLCKITPKGPRIVVIVGKDMSNNCQGMWKA